MALLRQKCEKTQIYLSIENKVENQGKHFKRAERMKVGFSVNNKPKRAKNAPD